MKSNLIIVGCIALAVLILSAPSTARSTIPHVINPKTEKNGTYLLSENKERYGTSGDALDTYLSRLAWTYECTGDCARAHRKGERYRRIDSNGQYSYGCLQYQQATYLAAAKKYGLDPWAGDGIYDCDNQWQITRAMFLEDRKAASYHWYTSVYTRGLGLPEI